MGIESLRVGSVILTANQMHGTLGILVCKRESIRLNGETGLWSNRLWSRHPKGSLNTNSSLVASVQELWQSKVWYGIQGRGFDSQRTGQDFTVCRAAETAEIIRGKMRDHRCLWESTDY